MKLRDVVLRSRTSWRLTPIKVSELHNLRLKSSRDNGYHCAGNDAEEFEELHFDV